MESYLSFARAHEREIIALVKELVECESPSFDAPAVDRFVQLMADTLAGAGKVKTFPGGRFGKILRCEFTLPGRKKDGQVLALGHSDTVWSMGTLQKMPFRQADGRLWGPGVLDMKSGIVFFIFAMRALLEADRPVKRRIVL